MTRLWVCLIIIFLTFGSGAAKADNWYLNISAGGTFLQDADNAGTSSGLSVENTFDAGPVVIGAIGRKFKNGFRFEGELSYRQNDIDKFTSVNAGGTTISLGSGLSGDGDVSSFGFMLNGAYDFMAGKKWSPFIMAGIGGAHLSINDASVAGVALADDSTTVFAYQVGTGINYNFNDKIALGISYRYFGTADPSFSDSTGAEFESEYSSHSVLAGLTFSF
ncbi:MAG: outer membrane beta-barrel protein [Rhodospirillales bacterium]